jgi:hypothetical protein
MATNGVSALDPSRGTTVVPGAGARTVQFNQTLASTTSVNGTSDTKIPAAVPPYKLLTGAEAQSEAQRIARNAPREAASVVAAREAEDKKKLAADPHYKAPKFLTLKDDIDSGNLRVLGVYKNQANGGSILITTDPRVKESPPATDAEKLQKAVTALNAQDREIVGRSHLAQVVQAPQPLVLRVQTNIQTDQNQRVIRARPQ